MTMKFNVAISWFLLFTNEQYFKLNTFETTFDNMTRCVLEKCNVKSNKYFIFYALSCETTHIRQNFLERDNLPFSLDTVGSQR